MLCTCLYSGGLNCPDNNCSLQTVIILLSIYFGKRQYTKFGQTNLEFSLCVLSWHSEYFYTGCTVAYALSDCAAGRNWSGYNRLRRGSVTSAHMSTPSSVYSARGTTGWTCWRNYSATIMKWNMYVHNRRLSYGIYSHSIKQYFVCAYPGIAMPVCACSIYLISRWMLPLIVN